MIKLKYFVFLQAENKLIINQNRQEMGKIDLNKFRFKRNQDKECTACNNIISYFKDKTNEKKTPTKLKELILLQICEAYDLIFSTEETEEHIMLDRIQKYLKIKIDELNCMDLNDVKGNTFDDCILYLEKIAKGTNEEIIKNRLDFFINELKSRYNG